MRLGIISANRVEKEQTAGLKVFARNAEIFGIILVADMFEHAKRNDMVEAPLDVPVIL